MNRNSLRAIAILTVLVMFSFSCNYITGQLSGRRSTPQVIIPQEATVEVMIEPTETEEPTEAPEPTEEVEPTETEEAPLLDATEAATEEPTEEPTEAATPESPDSTQGASGLPEDVPMYPDAKVMTSEDGLVIFSTTDSLDDIKTFYESALTDAGYEKQDFETDQADVFTQTWTKGNDSVIISGSVGGGESFVTIMSLNFGQ